MKDPDKFCIIDCREKIEYEVSFIPKAVHFTGTNFEREDTIFANNQAPVLFYCSIGYRSSLAARRFQECFPWRNVYNLEGSIFEYANKGHTLQKKDGQTNDSGLIKVHGYGKNWCKLLKKEYRYLD